MASNECSYKRKIGDHGYDEDGICRTCGEDFYAEIEALRAERDNYMQALELIAAHSPQDPSFNSRDTARTVLLRYIDGN